MPDFIRPFDRALTVPFGATGGTGIRVITYPDGVTSQRADRGQYFVSPFATLQDFSGFAVQPNRTYFAPYNVPKDTAIQSLRIMSANTAITGNCYFTVWSANPDNGYPQNRLYASASTVVGSGYNFTTVTNSAGLVSVPAGNFWIAVTYSSNPTVYAQHKNQVLPFLGASDPMSGYKYIAPIVDATGFTAPTGITATGLTFALWEYTASTYAFPAYQWQAR